MTESRILYAIAWMLVSTFTMVFIDAQFVSLTDAQFTTLTMLAWVGGMMLYVMYKIRKFDKKLQE